MALLTVAGVGAGLLGDRRRGLVGADQSRRRLLALSSGLLLSAWSIALFEHTPYLEPLPGSAGWTAMALLVLAAAGAGVLSAWQGWTLLMVPAAFVGLVDLSRTMFDSASSVSRSIPLSSEGSCSSRSPSGWEQSLRASHGHCAPKV